jgi:tetratricopeptide (TPR) repeat protein
MIKLSLLLLLSFSTLFVSSCASESDAESATPVSKESVPVTQLISQADDLYKKRADLAKLREGISLLRRARNADSKNFEANWKLAQSNYFLGKFTTDEKESEKAFKDGIDAGKVAANLQKDKPEGYFWIGANLGGRAEKSPITYGLSSLGEIRENMNKVIEIQPDYQAASAYDALAQLELETRLTGGKAEKALEYLEKGVKLGGDNSYIHLHLAETYLALGRSAEAKKQIDFVLNTKPDPDYLPEFEDAKKDAEKLLKTRF